ncbi:hypothetical protein HK414_01950 [Ramlibacter terrae]|uniref:histidine kinase n=1 Tax=Ramlibacter terrae TaxID=2732511 RepID=A0ABX6NZZ9_9BURK|nr:hypothetical protein HK414_01950 [Ramlibacter terrae]
MDRRGAVVARTANPERFVNQKAPADDWARMEAAPGRVVRVRSLEGEPLLASLHRSPTYGWGFVIGVPESQITSPARAASVFAGIAVLLLVASLLAALRLGRHIVEPIRRLAASVETMGRGGLADPQPTGLAETETVARALRDADASIHAASAELEGRVRAAVDEAEKAQKAMLQNQRLEAIGQLTGGVAHDFNNLLMVVDTNAHLLRRRMPELAQDVHIARIQRAVGTGTRLTRQLLAFSRRQPLRPQRLELAQVLPELMELVRPTLTSRVQVHCEVEPGTASVLVDPAEFELAIINLSVNARDAMPDGGTLRVRARNAHDDALGAVVLVEVADTGEGIPAELLGKVFEPFFTTKEIGRGTGLGLSQSTAWRRRPAAPPASRRSGGKARRSRWCCRRRRRWPRWRRTPSPRRRPPWRAACCWWKTTPNWPTPRANCCWRPAAVQHARSADDALALLERMQPLPEVVLSDIRMPGEIDGLGRRRGCSARGRTCGWC